MIYVNPFISNFVNNGVNAGFPQFVGTFWIVDELGFMTSEWLHIEAVIFFTTTFSNIFWGIVAKNWVGYEWFVGMAASSLAFYYVLQ
ncbi:hypothetical protein EF931_21660 [Salmonella enterica]|nr:hypothetical protein [Salmonella enterica]EJK8997439.1 hypothetical protein [Salmonella enterica]